MFDRVSRLERRFKRIAESLRPFELQGEGDDTPLDEAALQEELYSRHHSHRVLGYYSEHGIRKAFDAYGITSALRERGFDTYFLELLVEDPGRHQVRVYYRPERTPEHLLVDLAVHVSTARELVDCPKAHQVDLLVVDWLMLQDPRLSSADSPLLPGQRHPGLGMGLEFGALIGQIAHRLELDGCLTSPAWFHNAVFYQIRYHFVSPAIEGYFRALLRDTAGHPIEHVSWAIELGAVYEIPGETVVVPREPTKAESLPTVSGQAGALPAGSLPTGSTPAGSTPAGSTRGAPSLRDKAQRMRQEVGRVIPPQSAPAMKALDGQTTPPIITSVPPGARRLHWRGHPMIWPMSEGLQAYFERAAWKGHRDAIFDGVRFYVDWDHVYAQLPKVQSG